MVTLSLHRWECDSSTLQQLQHIATHCNTLQHIATHCNTLHMYHTPTLSLYRCVPNKALLYAAAHIQAAISYLYIDRKNPPLGGLFGWFSNFEPGEKGTPFFENMVFFFQRRSSSSGRFIWKQPKKETSPFKGSLLIIIYIGLHIYTYIELTKGIHIYHTLTLSLYSYHTLTLSLYITHSHSRHHTLTLSVSHIHHTYITLSHAVSTDVCQVRLFCTPQHTSKQHAAMAFHISNPQVHCPFPLLYPPPLPPTLLPIIQMIQIFGMNFSQEKRICIFKCVYYMNMYMYVYCKTSEVRMVAVFVCLHGCVSVCLLCLCVCVSVCILIYMPAAKKCKTSQVRMGLVCLCVCGCVYMCVAVFMAMGWLRLVGSLRW